MIPTVAAQQRSRSNFHETQNADGALRVHPASGRPFFRGAPRGSAVRGGLLPPGRGSGGPNPSITASEVEANPTPANLMTYALVAKNYIEGQGIDQNALAYSAGV